MSFNSERRAFNRLKNDCSGRAKAEFEEALRILIERYNTTLYENRFIVGGAVEVFTYALLRSVGVACQLYGDIEKSGDILLPNHKHLSIKSSFKGGLSNIRLLNKMGEGERFWDTATLFIVANVGIIYGAPDMVSPEDIKDAKDAVELKRSGLKLLANDERNVFDIHIPQKPSTEMTGFSQKASTAVAKQVLSEAKSSSLLSSMGISLVDGVSLN
ncbi:MAG: hypothetical protein F4039_10725 [Gammaproteobacteria bacterium]|nr:hypothetical protein [Gammaproteobacteria bacterium]MYF53238.1 hypothetical protein [Gammaproteobacteria bacterium]MYK44540.1 hypothetical protein [Gammaproteobacteria bacterium]